VYRFQVVNIILFLPPVLVNMKYIYRFIFFRLMGWKIVGAIEPSLKKCVMIVVPHTSWIDFFIGVMARGSIGLEMHYVAKKELFVFPFSTWFRWMGGTPLDRQKNENKVDAIAAIFIRRKVFRLAIAPEGTRKKVDCWKTGFYYIALKANVPVVAVAFDYGKKQVKIAAPFYPTTNKDADFKILESHYKGITGYVPEYSYKN
jgi:1-acyl-sn-glycerol-3-phosphate acyltransferase